MIEIAVLISDKGTGTNLQAIIDAIKSGKLDAKISVVVSDTPKSVGLKRAKKNNLEVAICPEKNQLKAILEKYQPDYIALAGWKQIITDDVIELFPNKIINLHPGIVPNKFNGTFKNPDNTNALWNRGLLAEKAINNFLAKKATYGGSSIHFLTKKFDFGPVLARAFVKIKKNDTVDSLYSRIKIKEHEIYVEVLQRLAKEKKATVLVIDGGGRGAVLAHKYSQSKHVGKILVIPGNDLIQLNIKKSIKIYPDLKTTSLKEIVEIAKKEKVGLVDVAQDNAIERGLVDELKNNGIQVIGPTRKAGQIEWDKAWARDFMVRHAITHPSFKILHSKKDGVAYLHSQKTRSWFVKASGLTYGRGVYPAKDNDEAIQRISQLKEFGKEGNTYLIEEALVGEEFSSYALSDGKDFVILGHAQDNKRLENFDQGLNTGGIGANSPSLLITEDLEEQIKKIFKKTIDGLRKEGRIYVGILYLGGMVVKIGKPKVYVIEFNARWGDPEVEVVLPAIKNDLFELSLAAVSGKISGIKIKLDGKSRLLVTACAKGYFDLTGVRGKQIFGVSTLLKMKGVTIYGSGTKKLGNKYYVSGSRMLHIVGEGGNIIESRTKAYNAISQVSVEGNNLHFRTDIGFRDLQRLKNKK